MQVAAPGVTKVAGEQDNPLSWAVVASVMVVVSETPLACAVIVAIEELVMTPAAAEKVVVDAPALTVTAAGTVSRPEFDERPTANPPAGAACVRDTVHVAVPPDARAVGEHETSDNRAGARRVSAKFWVTPP